MDWSCRTGYGVAAVHADAAEVRVYDMAEHMMKMLMSIMAALSFGSLLFLVAIL